MYDSTFNLFCFDLYCTNNMKFQRHRNFKFISSTFIVNSNFSEYMISLCGFRFFWDTLYIYVLNIKYEKLNLNQATKTFLGRIKLFRTWYFSALSPFQRFIAISVFYPHFSVLSPISAFYPYFSILSPFQRFIPISVSAMVSAFSFRV